MKDSETPESSFKPKVLVYFCSSCCGPKSPGDHLSFAHLSETITSVHFKCAREVTPEQIQRGLAGGADGILICGCLVRDCENSPGDLDVLRSLYRNQLTIKKMGLVADRLREEWIVQGTTDHLERIVADFTAVLTALGPVIPAVATPASPDEKIGESRAG